MCPQDENYIWVTFSCHVTIYLVFHLDQHVDLQYQKMSCLQELSQRMTLITFWEPTDLFSSSTISHNSPLYRPKISWEDCHENWNYSSAWNTFSVLDTGFLIIVGPTRTFKIRHSPCQIMLFSGSTQCFWLFVGWHLGAKQLFMLSLGKQSMSRVKKDRTHLFKCKLETHWLTRIHLFTSFFYEYVHMQVLIYRDYLKCISIPMILSHIANGTVNNDQDTEEEVLVWIPIVHYYPDIFWLTWQPWNTGSCPWGAKNRLRLQEF